MAAPTKRQFACGKCGLVLPAEVFNTPELAECPRCRNLVLARIFPAFLEAAKVGRIGESLGVDDISGCFFHPERRAVVACGECGRFLCELCDLEIGGRHLCPNCLEAGRRKSTLAVFHTAHTRWDNIALMLAVIPLLIPFPGWYLSMFTAAAAMFISLWKWRAPTQALVPYNRGRSIVALLVGGLTLAGWATVLYFFLTNRFR